ncbi:phage tail protein [Actinomadura gamaensis]|uniref:Phage-related protein n=1 Tax=Actinomadura gamaensis TaxID=1763541 RepID=A0ABV9UAM7_9ACTN
MALRLGELVAIISADDTSFHKALGRVHAGLEKVGRAGRLAALSGALTQVAVAAGPAAGGVLSLGVSLGAALAPAAGIATALPAAAVAFKTAVGVMKLAVTGFDSVLQASAGGDVKKYTAALKELPPAARSVAKEVGTATFGLTKNVQQAFFKPIVAAARGLGRQVRSPIQNAFATAAGGLGRLTARVVAVARERRSIAAFGNVFAAIGITADRAGRGVAPLARGLRDLVGGMAVKLPIIGTLVGRVAAGLGVWLQNAVKTGRAQGWFDRALRILLQLGRIARNVGVTLFSVFSAANIGGGRMLGTIERLTARMAAWARSAQGRASLVAYFTKGRQVLAQLGRIAGNVGRALGGVFKQAGAGSNNLLGNLEKASARLERWANSAKGQQQLGQTFSMLKQVTNDLSTILPGVVVLLGKVAGFITGLPAPIRGVVTQTLAWAVVIGLVSSRIGPMVVGAGKIAQGIGKVGKAFTNGEGKPRRWASTLTQGTTRAARAVRTLGVTTGRAAASAGQAAGRLALAGARALGTAALAAGRAALSFITAAGRMAVAAGRAALTVVAAGARMALSATITAARVVAGWVLMGVQSMIQAARMAAAWLIAMGPVGIVVAIAIGAVALIIANWGRIVTFFTKTLPHWLKIGFDFIVGLIKTAAKYGFLGPVGLIISHWGAISDFFTKTLPHAVGSGISAVVGWLRRLPGFVVLAVGNMGKLLVNAGKNVLIGFWNGLVSMGNWLARSIGNLIKRIVPGPVLRVLGIASPSKLFKGYGVNVAQGLALGMADSTGLVSTASADLARATTGPKFKRAVFTPSGWNKSKTSPFSRAIFTPTPVRAPGHRRSTNLGGFGGGRDVMGVVRVVFDFKGADGEFKRFIRKIVRVDGRGNVQLAFKGR